MPIKESKLKTYITIGIIAYIFCIYLSLHMASAAYGTPSEEAVQVQQTAQFGGVTQIIPSEQKVEINWLDAFVDGLTTATTDPLAFLPIKWQAIFPMLFFLFADVFVIGFMAALDDSKKQSAPGKEHGSARWNVDYKRYYEEYVKPYNPQKDAYDENIIFSKRTKLWLNNKATQRNMNVLAIGGSGTGKSWRIVKPNIMQKNCSMVVTDPSGEILKCTGRALIEDGYNLKVFSTSDMEHSNCYNPLDYVYDENGEIDEAKVSTMVFLFLKNASGPKQNSGDPFWEKSAKAFLSALIYYLLENPNIDRKNINFNAVLKLTQAGKVSEQSDSSDSGLDILMNEHKERMQAMGKESKAISNYNTFKLAPGKTANSILISCAVDLQLFDNNKVINLTRTDEDKRNNICLDELGDSKSALFINIPQANGTFNFLVAMLYSQLFDSLYTKAEKICANKWLINDETGHPVISMIDSEKEATAKLEKLQKSTVTEFKTKRGAIYYQLKFGKEVLLERTSKKVVERILANSKKFTVARGGDHLPWHVRCLMDEFANIGEVPDFDKLLATMRKYEISCTVILQSIAQIKAKYEKLWESLVGNCDTLVFLGSSESETCKYISDLLGEATERVRNTSKSYKGGGSESYSATKRMLMTPQEVGNIPNNKRKNKCIVRIRGVDPFYDDKYDFLKHPHFKETGDYSPKNRIDNDFMDKYFNSTPIKRSTASKTKRQKASAEIIKKSKYTQGKETTEDIIKMGIKEDEIPEKIIPEKETPKNEKNKKEYVDRNKPLKPEPPKIEEDVASMSDEVFLF